MRHNFTENPAEQGIAGYLFKLLLLGLLLLCVHAAHAQRADENVITSAEDAFGTTVGADSIGLYDANSIRGFSAVAAGNLRIEGLYFDQQAPMTMRIQSGYAIHIGPAAQGYIFPAPTGIVDYSLRPSSDKPLLSAIATLDPFYSPRIELDAQLPLIDEQLSTAVGVSQSFNNYGHGGSVRTRSFGIVPHWQPAKNVDIKAFWGRAYALDDMAAPIYIPASSADTPPPVQRGHYPGPFWDRGENYGDNAGIMGMFNFGEWTLRAGVFHSVNYSKSSYVNLFTDVMPDGTGDHLIVANSPQRSASTSGEIRIARRIEHASFQHLLLASLRWRNVSARYDGADQLDAGTMNLNDPLLIDRPAFNFGPQSTEHVTQQTLGVTYSMRWKTILQLNMGVQHADYSRHDVQPGVSPASLNDSPWMQNLTMSVSVSPTLAVYGSYTRGLEDNGIAPDSAANRGQPLPVIKSRQYDMGISWTPADNTKLIVGYFDITKPYVTGDSNNVYRLLGEETHNGVELSLAAVPFTGMTIVVGGFLTDPRIKNVRGAGEVIGSEPVGQSRSELQFNCDYVLPFAPQVSLNAGINTLGSFATTVDNRSHNEWPTLVSAGGRYKFKIGHTPYTLRLSIANVTNAYYWYFAGANAYMAGDKMRTSLSLAADF